jgi:hypothetical protein
VDYYEDRPLLPKFCQFYRFKNFRKKHKCENLPEDVDSDDNDMTNSSTKFLRHQNFLGEDKQIKIVIEDFKSLNGINENENSNVGMSIDSLSEPMRRKSKLEIYFRRYDSFTRSPKVHFFYDAIFYGAFLLIFSYMLLCEFTYYSLDKVGVFVNTSFLNTTSTRFFSVNTFNSTHKIVYRKIVKEPSSIEILVIFWVTAFFFEELNQVKSKFGNLIIVQKQN